MVKGKLPCGKLMQTATYQVWMATHQAIETTQIVLRFDRAVITPVQLRDLQLREIFKCQSSAHVKRGLVEVSDEQACFGRIGDRDREVCPGARGIQRPFVMPGTQQTEDLAAE